MNREQLRAVLERHRMVHDYLCVCGWEWDITSTVPCDEQFVQHVLEAEAPE